MPVADGTSGAAHPGARFALPVVQGRGAGLGNELIAWGKAYVGAQALGLRPLHPAWGLNPRRYWRYFGTTRVDWLAHRCLRATLPAFHFTEEDYRRQPGLDLHQAVLDFSRRHELARRHAYVLCFSGMWGGLRAIRPAREYLRAQFLAARGTCENLYALERRIDPSTIRIGMHIRRGDFTAAPESMDFRNRFNTAIPLRWYQAIARRLAQQLGSRMTLLVVSDGSAQDLEPLTREFDCVLTDDRPDRDLSDLLALASCDLLVCSVSSFSLTAAFLSDARYLWFAPNLNAHDGVATIWGHEAAQRAPGGETASSIARVQAQIDAGTRPPARGVPVGWDGCVPDELLAHLGERLNLPRADTDLILYGAVPLG